MNALRIVRAAIPDADEVLVSHILWGRTAYPFCGPEDFARKLYRAASRWRRAAAHKLRLCELCDNVALHGDWTCVDCNAAMERNRREHESQSC